MRIRDSIWPVFTSRNVLLMPISINRTLTKRNSVPIQCRSQDQTDGKGSWWKEYPSAKWGTPQWQTMQNGDVDEPSPGLVTPLNVEEKQKYKGILVCNDGGNHIGIEKGDEKGSLWYDILTRTETPPEFRIRLITYSQKKHQIVSAPNK